MELHLTDKQKELLLICMDAVINAHDRGDVNDFMEPLEDYDLEELNDLYDSLDEQITE